MPIFFYKAKKSSAETVVGEISARDADEAVELISQMDLLPVSVEEKTGQETSGRLPRPRSVKGRDIYLFTRQLVSLLRSGVALLGALEILSRQTRNLSLRQVLVEISSNIRNGRSLSSCLADYPQIFSQLYVAMTRAGEESGKLREFLSNMAEHYRRQEEIAQKIRMALTYPLFMLVVGTATVIFILSFVLPRIMVLFKDLHTALPWPTVVVMKASDVVQKGWPVAFILVLVALILSRSGSQMVRVRRAFHRIVLVVPFFNTLAMRVDFERFARTLSLLLASGIPILKALEIAIPTLTSEALKADLWVCQAKVAGGAGLGETLRESALIPDMVAQLITVGEESGELAPSLRDIAETYEQEIGETTKTLTTLLEPLLILAVGLVVGFIVFAMLMPIFQMDIFAR